MICDEKRDWMLATLCSRYPLEDRPGWGFQWGGGNKSCNAVVHADCDSTLKKSEAFL
jgi:hypothetical protein